MSNMFDDQEYDPYDLLLSNILRVQELEKIAELQQSQIARLSFLNNQLASNMKELTNYVTTHLNGS